MDKHDRQVQKIREAREQLLKRREERYQANRSSK